MHEAALSHAALPTRVVICELLMRPFSIGHLLWLYREDLFDAAITGAMSPRQLSSAALICSQTWEESASIDTGWLVPIKIKIWNWRVRRAAVAQLKQAPAAPYYFCELSKFANYLSSGSMDFPESEIPREAITPSRSPGRPFLLSLQQWLMVEFRMTESQSWNYPFGLAKMRWAAHWEAQGGIDIKNKREVEWDLNMELQEARDRLESEQKQSANN